MAPEGNGAVERGDRERRGDADLSHEQKDVALKADIPSMKLPFVGWFHTTLDVRWNI